MSELQNKVITIDSVEQTTTASGKTRFRVKTTEGLTYGLWKVKSDGTETKAYEGLKELGLDAAGREVGIAYSEEQGEYEGKPQTYRTIVMLVTDASQMRIDTPQESSDLLAKVNDLINRVGKLENLANVSATPVIQTEEPVAKDTPDIFSPPINKDEIKVSDIPF